jgi:hypothetical protein
MKRGPDGYVPLEDFRRRFGIDPAALEAVLAVGGISAVMHDGELWVHDRGAQAWLASDPVHPAAFAMLGATIGGKPIVRVDAEADTGDAA